MWYNEPYFFGKHSKLDHYIFVEIEWYSKKEYFNDTAPLVSVAIHKSWISSLYSPGEMTLDNILKKGVLWEKRLLFFVISENH